MEIRMKATTLNIRQGTIQDVRFMSAPTTPSLLETTSARIYDFFDQTSQSLADTWEKTRKSESV